MQKTPKKMPKMMGKDDVKEAANVLEGAWQMWHVNGTRCPKGTIPIRRNTMNDVLRAKSLFDFGKKRRSIDLDRRTEKPDALGTNGHEVHSIIISLLFSIYIMKLVFDYISMFNLLKPILYTQYVCLREWLLI